MPKRGYKQTKEHKIKLSQSHLGKTPSDKTKEKISKSLMGHTGSKGSLGYRWKTHKPAWNKGLTKETDERVANYVKKVKKTLKGRNTTHEHYKKILVLKGEMEEQGFRCIPLGKVIPDIIAIKDNKIFAVELEYGKPNYDKYTSNIQHFFDDVIWIIKRGDKGI